MVEYNPFMDEVLYGDPYPVYARMRAEDPVYYVEEYDAWFLSRFEDIWRAGPDFEHFSAQRRHHPAPPAHEGHAAQPLVREHGSAAALEVPRPGGGPVQARRGGSRRARAAADREGPRRRRSSIAASATSCRTSRPRCRCAARSSVIGLPLELADRASGWVNGIFARRDGHRGATEKSMEGGEGHVLHDARSREAGAQEPGEGDRRDAASCMNSDVDGDKMDDFRLASLCCVVLIGGTDTLPKALAATLLPALAEPRPAPRARARSLARARRVPRGPAPRHADAAPRPHGDPSEVEFGGKKLAARAEVHVHVGVREPRRGASSMRPTSTG